MQKMIFKRGWFFGILLCVLAVFGATQQVEAAGNGIVLLELYPDMEATYTKYDVTGDSVKDTVKVTLTYPNDEMYSGTMKVYVNGDLVFEQTREQDPGWTVKLIKLKNGKVFFDIASTIVSDDCCIHHLYVYKNKQLKSVYDFQKYYEQYATYYNVETTAVSGNTIKTTVWAQFYTTGMINFNMNVAYKNGSFKRTANTFRPNFEDPTKKWTAGRTIKVYKSAGSTKLAYTLKKGNTVQLNKIVYKNNKVYFQVKRSNGKGKTGYIPCAKKWTNPQYFDEAQFAG